MIQLTTLAYLSKHVKGKLHHVSSVESAKCLGYSNKFNLQFFWVLEVFIIPVDSCVLMLFNDAPLHCTASNEMGI